MAVGSGGISKMLFFLPPAFSREWNKEEKECVCVCDTVCAAGVFLVQLSDMGKCMFSLKKKRVFFKVRTVFFAPFPPLAERLFVHPIR